MRPMALPQAALLGGLLAVALVPAVTAQGRGRAKPAPEAPATLGADSLNNLKFRNLGPSVGGGRVTAVVGIPGEPNVYYVGAAAGGVDRKSTRLNSSHTVISYAVFCLK